MLKRLAHAIGRTFPIDSVEKFNSGPLSSGKEEVRTVQDGTSHHSAVPMEERPGAGDLCSGLLPAVSKAGSVTEVASARAVCECVRGDYVRMPRSMARLYDILYSLEACNAGLVAETVSGLVVNSPHSWVECCKTWIRRKNVAPLRAYGKAGFTHWVSWRTATIGSRQVYFGTPWVGNS